MYSTSTHDQPTSMYQIAAQEAQRRTAIANAHSGFDSDAPPVPSESLLRGQKVVEIVHNGSLYKLQATKLGKLILTK
jgi:hemin uptake protein HemP